MSVGEGMLTTIDKATPSSHWIAYQFLCGFGLGFGMQTSGLAIQAVLNKADLPLGIALNMFVQQLGGAVFTSVGQTILTNLLVSRLSDIPDFNPKDIVDHGATLILEDASPELKARIIDAYEYACKHIFIAAMSLAFAALICSFFMEWINIKKGRGAPSQAPEDPPTADAASARNERIGPVAPTELTSGQQLIDGSKRHSKSSSYRDSIIEQKLKGKEDKTGTVSEEKKPEKAGVVGAEIIRPSSTEEKKSEAVLGSQIGSSSEGDAGTRTTTPKSVA